MLLTGQTTERLRFEKVNLNHFDQWLIFFEDPSTSLHWHEAKESPQRECEKWYDKQQWRYQNNKGGMNALIEKASGRLVGHAGLLVQHVDGVEELEIGYSLLPAFWHQGYAFEAAAFCKRVALANTLAPSLISIISVTNLPSQKVALKNGMTIDKRTRYHENDVFIYRTGANR